MTHRGAPCWDPNEVRTVMNVDGEAVLDAVFTAVDTPYDLWLQSGAEGQRSSLTRDQFLQQFISPTLPNARAVILGQAGSGKSHIIKWLEITLKGHPDAQDAHVLSIPRSGVSLRGILDAIIDVLPDAEQDEFRTKLDQAGYRFADDVERRQNLISFLGLAIAADRKRSTDAAYATIERTLVGRDGNTVQAFSLSNLFDDPFLRHRWVTTSNGPIARLVEHIVEVRRGSIARDEEFAFTEADLPLTGQDHAQLAAPSRQVVQQLIARPAWKTVALDLIKRNIRVAINRMLNFSGDDLIQLLASVRRSLKREGKSLILLIEDLARLEGIDAALLEALIEPPRTGGDELCNLRWAMAVTTGYFEQTAQTVRSRVNFVVDMDLRTSGDLSTVTTDEIVAFAARYLNATRLGVSALTDWHAGNLGQASLTPVPNACTQGPRGECPYLSECHEAFGDSDFLGLYPFNRTAIQSMLRRFEESARGQFNPRRLLKDVLAEVLAGYHREIEAGTFPDSRLREQFVVASDRLVPVAATRVTQQSPEYASHQIPILELWGGSRQLTRVHPGIYEAFGVPEVQLDGSTPPPPPPVVGPRQPEPRSRDTLTDLIEAVQTWGNEGDLAQHHLDPLRQRVFAAVCERIDWNTLGISRGQVAGGTGRPFRPGFINFQGQATTPTQGTVTLTIPADDAPEARTRAALAIGGLLLFERHGRWDSADGYTMLVALAEELDAWAACVVNQIRALPDGRGAWNPAPTAVELLAVGAVLGGRDGLVDGRLSGLTSAIFQDAAWPDQAPTSAAEWRTIYDEIKKQRPQLIQIARTWAGGDKGSVQSAFLDPQLVADAVERLRASWAPSMMPAELSPNDDRCIALVRLASAIGRRVPTAATALHKEALSWLAQVEPHLDDSVGRDALIELLRSVLDDAFRVGGIFTSTPERNAVERALDGLASLDLDAAVAAARKARTLSPLVSWPLLTRPAVYTAIQQSGPIVVALDRFLTGVQNATQREITEAERGANLTAVREQIRATLSQLDGLLGTIGGEQHV